MNKLINSSTLCMLIVTIFGVGKIPLAPGTFGSLAALMVGYSLQIFFIEKLVIAFIILILFFIGIISIYIYNEGATEVHDNKEIVIDEFVGQLVALSFIEFSLLNYFLIFILFRFFDIFKPWPCNVIDARIKNSWGIMFDDIAASIQAIVSFKFIMWIL